MRKALVLALTFAVFAATLSAGERKQVKILFGKPESRFKITPPKWNTRYGSMHVTLWENGKIACVTKGIDDNIQGEHDWWIEAGRKLDMKFTWFVIVHPCIFDYDGKPATKASGIVKIEKFQRLFKEGHDVQAHGGSRINKLPEAGYEKDLVFAKKMLEERIPGNKVLVYAYPSGDGGGHKNVVAARHYIAARGTVGAANHAARIRYEWTNDADWGKEKIDALLDPKNGTYRGWVSSLDHKVGMGVTRDSKKAALEAKFEQLKYVADKRDQLWITVYRKAALYGQERDTHKLTPGETTPRKITFNLSDDMDDSLFDYPLTVKITLDPSWDELAVTQGGKPASGRIILHKGTKFALIRAIPDRGEVVVTKVAPTVASHVQMSPGAGTYKNSVAVVLQTITSDAKIHYTTDGSEPTPQSPTYTAPVVLDKDATIVLKTIAVKAGLTQGPVASGEYKVWLDKEAPKVLGAVAVGERITIFFTEELAKNDAESIANYTIPGVTVTKATLLADQKNVILDVTGIRSGFSAVLKVVNIKDTSGNIIAAGAQAPVKAVAKPADAGLVGYWTFDEPDGASVAIDSTGGKLPGLIENAKRTAGKIGNAILLKRSSKGVLARSTDFGIRKTGEFSISLWCRYEKGWKGNIFCSKGLQPFAIKPHYHGARFRSAFRDSNTRYLSGKVDVPKGEWFHYAVVAGKDTFKTYLNGKLDVEQKVDGSKGGYHAGKVDYILGGGFNGMIDDLKLYNRPLTQDEIRKMLLSQ